MADDEDLPKQDAPAGAPMWVVTFSDMMSLLLCFFILLLSMSTTQVVKFEEMKGSLKDAFGVETKSKKQHLPMGRSVLKDQFSQAIPSFIPWPDLKSDASAAQSTSQEEAEDSVEAYVEEKYAQLLEIFDDELKAQGIEVEKSKSSIKIKIPETVSFPSGSSQMRAEFSTVLVKLVKALKLVNGRINIVGHSDDEPIATAQFRSNWELSASRALAVAHSTMKVGKLDSSRFVVTGAGPNHPADSNATPEGRSRNRRVEIYISPEIKF